MKSNLKDGDIVTLKNGLRGNILKDFIILDNFSMILDSYTENLHYKRDCEELDIVKVERVVKYKTIFERKDEILDKIEKEYLSALIKPFKKEITFITKIGFDGEEFLKISFKRHTNSFSLPFFKENSMYKKMKVDANYTLKELGL